MLVRLFRGPFLNYNYKEGNSQLFYRNFHLLPQFHRNKHLKNTATFTATCWKSPREISNFRLQLSQKRPAKSWGDWFIITKCLRIMGVHLAIVRQTVTFEEVLTLGF